MSGLQRNLAKPMLESLACGCLRALTTQASGNSGASGSTRRIGIRAGGRGRAHHELWPAQRPLPTTTFWAAVITRPRKSCLAAHLRGELHICSSHETCPFVSLRNENCRRPVNLDQRKGPISASNTHRSGDSSEFGARSTKSSKVVYIRVCGGFAQCDAGVRGGRRKDTCRCRA